MTNHPDFQVGQRILKDVQAGGNITIGDIHQIYANRVISGVQRTGKPFQAPPLPTYYV